MKSLRDNRGPHSLSFTAGVGIAILVASGAVIGSAPPNVISGNASSEISGTAAFLMPQGWGFFTRDAREATYSLWTQEANEWRMSQTTRDSQLRYALGADRTARMIGIDLDYVAASLPKTGWKKCPPGQTPTCLKDAVHGVPVPLRAADDSICGLNGVVRSSAIPWAYARFTREARTEVQVVEVVC